MAAINVIDTHWSEERTDKWKRFVWLALVALTLGLCLLAVKRQVEQPLYASKAAAEVGRKVEFAIEPVKASRMVVKVKQVSPRPIWTSGTLSSEVMHDGTYDRA